MKPCIAVGVTGGIAAYKALQLVSNLVKKGYEVHVIMSKNATEFVTPLSFETISHNRVSVDTFDRNFEYDVQHISLAQKADCFVVAPASANFIAKAAHGLADDMLTTTFLAAECPKIICPAMNTHMLENPITQDNIKTCQKYGMMFVDSESGILACKDVGKGRLADVAEIEEAVECALVKDKFLSGKKLLVSAGATVEHVDPVRTLSNPSTGKMGVAVAKVAKRLGAEVTLVANTREFIPKNVDHVIPFTSAKSLADIVLNHFEEMDIIVMAAAVSDYTPSVTYDHKVKKSDDDLFIPLERTTDILAECGKRKTHQLLCGFAMETENLENYATQKLIKKNLDLIAANNLFVQGAGFATDTNVMTLITSHDVTELPLMSKEKTAYEILKKLMGETYASND